LSRNAPTVGFIWASPTRNFAKSATVSGYPAKNFTRRLQTGNGRETAIGKTVRVTNSPAWRIPDERKLNGISG